MEFYSKFGYFDMLVFSVRPNGDGDICDLWKIYKMFLKYGRIFAKKCISLIMLYGIHTNDQSPTYTSHLVMLGQWPLDCLSTDLRFSLVLKTTRLSSIQSQPKKVVVVVVFVVVVKVSHRKPIFKVWSKLSQLLYIVSVVGVVIL